MLADRTRHTTAAGCGDCHRPGWVWVQCYWVTAPLQFVKMLVSGGTGKLVGWPEGRRVGPAHVLEAYGDRPPVTPAPGPPMQRRGSACRCEAVHAVGPSSPTGLRQRHGHPHRVQGGPRLQSLNAFCPLHRLPCSTVSMTLLSRGGVANDRLRPASGPRSRSNPVHNPGVSLVADRAPENLTTPVGATGLPPAEPADGRYRDGDSGDGCLLSGAA